MPRGVRTTSSRGPTKAQQIADAVRRATRAGEPQQVEVLDFSDPDRPKSCLEVDFPIVPINRVAAIEGNAGKPIYQLGKWWARRRSSVFRSMLLAAAMKAPEDEGEAARAVWDVYYGNHQGNKAMGNLRVADIFMGGGTTVIEGSRLGMQMVGNDLNPVAWFVTKTAMANVTREEVQALLHDIEAEVRPQIMPFYACDGPNGEKGTWTHLPTGRVMGPDFDATTVPPAERSQYKYVGPEMVYVFWAKHGPCATTGCGHRTPLHTSPVVAKKRLTVNSWATQCRSCHLDFDIEAADARMAPDVPLAIAEGGKPRILASAVRMTCPRCHASVDASAIAAKPVRKPILLWLLVHPEWMAGDPQADDDGAPLGGSATDDPEATARWLRRRAGHARLLEVRAATVGTGANLSDDDEDGAEDQGDDDGGADDDAPATAEAGLPEWVTCPQTGKRFRTTVGTVPKRSTFACATCGTQHDVLTAVRASGKTGPLAPYAIQAFSPKRKAAKAPYLGRFFAEVRDTRPFEAAEREWAARRDSDLAAWWPRSELPYGFMTHHMNGGVPNHGITHWWKMFNARQLLVNALLLRAICTTGGTAHRTEVREYVLAAFQQFLRNECLLTIWDLERDCLVPGLSNANFHPKSNMIENAVFTALGRGNWDSNIKGLYSVLDFHENPYDVCAGANVSYNSGNKEIFFARSNKVYPNDPITSADLLSINSSNINTLNNSCFDLVITDPPFGGLIHYSELSDFFYVWLRLAQNVISGKYFETEYAPKVDEAVANPARHGEDADTIYADRLRACWAEAHRILKPGGTLAFTFHHSEDAPWVAVLDSLFTAGFTLEATYPIRSDERKGSGQFGSRTIEYDIIHVCRKRRGDPEEVSWPRMRREVVREIEAARDLLEHHRTEGLPDADLRVIMRGKALEFYSRHYGKVMRSDGEPMSVAEALVGVNTLIDDTASDPARHPPTDADPYTRQYLRLFGENGQVDRDNAHKALRGTGMTVQDFVDLKWCAEVGKAYVSADPREVARQWHGRHRTKLTRDFDQVMFLVGACHEQSGISVQDTLRNPNFTLHGAVPAILQWLATRAWTAAIRDAANRALALVKTHLESQPAPVSRPRLALFEDDK